MIKQHESFWTNFWEEIWESCRKLMPYVESLVKIMRHYQNLHFGHVNQTRGKSASKITGWCLMLLGTEEMRVGVTILGQKFADSGSQVTKNPNPHVLKARQNWTYLRRKSFLSLLQPEKPLEGCLGATNSHLRRLLRPAYQNGQLFPNFLFFGIWNRKHSPVLLYSSGINLPRGSNSMHSSNLPSARTVSLKLHHERDFPLGHILDGVTGQGSDPTCNPHNRFSTKEFNQFCPKSPDDRTAARLGGNGAMVTHMVRKILAENVSFWRWCNLVSLWHTHFLWQLNQVILQKFRIRLKILLRAGLLQFTEPRMLQYWHQV